MSHPQIRSRRWWSYEFNNKNSKVTGVEYRSDIPGFCWCGSAVLTEARQRASLVVFEVEALKDSTELLRKTPETHLSEHSSSFLTDGLEAAGAVDAFNGADAPGAPIVDPGCDGCPLAVYAVRQIEAHGASCVRVRGV